MTLTPYNHGFPRIAIIGRPNVGKSTLFNVLLKKRKAITDPVSGVTRDAIESEFKLGNRTYILTDTGGISREKAGFGGIVAEKSEKTAMAADLILLMVDVNDISPDDLTLMEKLRIHEKKTFLVINKVDNEKMENMAYNLYQYGFQTTISISASHRKNISQLINEIKSYFSIHTAKNEGKETAIKENEPKPVRIAILGKPNTGKSTLINYLTGEEKSLVSPLPGTTRDVVGGNFRYRDTLFEIYDTAGIRRKSRVKEDIEYYSVQRAIKCIDEVELVFFLVDSLDGISQQDKKIVQLAEKKGRGIILVLNKWDLLPKIANRFEATVDRIHFLFPVFKYAPVVPVSAISGWNVDKLLNTGLKLIHQLNRRIETSKLNTAVHKWIKEFPVKTRGKVVSVKYATQVTVNPVKFMIFVNTINAFRGDYLSFLMNRIKKELGFANIPIELIFKKSDGTKVK
ncbi:MAG: ribosome biogenesis GTPase Der [Spirochaetales bacterium]|nr:ribosome biogenesis GTPase Der [Spirochaetales bacterium]